MEQLDYIKSTIEGTMEEAKINVSSSYGDPSTTTTTSILEYKPTPYPLILINPHDDEGNQSTRDHQPSPPLPTKRWSIFKVPPHLCHDSRQSYEPRFVSVGPFHYKRPGLELMEAQKSRFVTSLTAGESRAVEDAMKELEEKTRGCYSEEFKDIESESFTRMMLVDGYFVVQLLRLSGKNY